MRFCVLCNKAMYSSNESIWIKNKNYSCHIKCKKLKELLKEKEGVEK